MFSLIFIVLFIVLFYMVYCFFVKPKGYTTKEISDMLLSAENLRYQIELTKHDDAMFSKEKQTKLDRLTNELDFLTLALNAKGYKYGTTTRRWYKK